MRDSSTFEMESEVSICDRGHHELCGRKKIPVAILGATGAVGQRMVSCLSSHPWFEIVQLMASERSAGKRYCDAVQWLLSEPIPSHIAEMFVSGSNPHSGIALAFSALDSSVAEEVELKYADYGVPVVTNAKSNRMKESVPLLIPEVNLEHLQRIQRGSRGFIVANPNCAAIGLCLGLKPLISAFGIDAIHVTTYQSISGAGFPGVSALLISDNLIPYIPDEEEKLESEPIKIFSTLEDGVYKAPKIKISASCVRVPVTEGHLESVSVSFIKKPKHIDNIAEAFAQFSSPLDALNLPSAPKRAIQYFSDKSYPQPRLHRNLGNGMTVSIGGLRPCSLFDAKFFLLSHNTIRGAAGGAILIGELLVQQSLIFW